MVNNYNWFMRFLNMGCTGSHTCYRSYIDAVVFTITKVFCLCVKTGIKQKL